MLFQVRVLAFPSSTPSSRTARACKLRIQRLTKPTDYLDSQDHLARLDPNAKEHNNDYVGIASYNIWAGVFTATIFGAAFFFDLFWPERHESRSVRWAWKICSLVCIAFILGDVIAYTVYFFPPKTDGGSTPCFTRRGSISARRR